MTQPTAPLALARKSKVKCAATRSRNRWSRKKVRNSAFVQWLLCELAEMRPDCGEAAQSERLVLDVAGGNGKVGALLALTHGIPCVIVDPARVRLSQRMTRDVVRRALRPAEETAQPARAPPELLWADVDGVSSPCADWLHPKGVAEAGPYESAAAESAAVRAAIGALTAAGLRHVRAPFAMDFPAKLPALWARSVACVGMHPDQATDAIVDLCLAAQKPFAVVPCCVFPRLFNTRVLRSRRAAAAATPDLRGATDATGSGAGEARVAVQTACSLVGSESAHAPAAIGAPDAAPPEWVERPVRSYEDYIAWLRAKDGAIRVAELSGVPGRSLVLFHTLGVARCVAIDADAPRALHTASAP